MEPTIKPNYETTFHRDGTVSYWNVFSQQWAREAAEHISDETLATLNQEERNKIAKMAETAVAHD